MAARTFNNLVSLIKMKLMKHSAMRELARAWACVSLPGINPQLRLALAQQQANRLVDLRPHVGLNRYTVILSH